MIFDCDTHVSLQMVMQIHTMHQWRMPLAVECQLSNMIVSVKFKRMGI